MVRIRLLLAMLLFVIQDLSAHKVLLVSSFIGQSHVNFVSSIADALVDGGHVVHMIEVEFHPNVRPVETKAHKVFVLFKPGAVILQVIRVPRRRYNPIGDIAMGKNPFQEMAAIDSEQWELWKLAIDNHCRDVVDALPELIVLRGEKYDIGMSEIYGLCNFMAMHHIGIKAYALLTAVPLFPFIASTFGIPQPTSFVANPMTEKYTINAPHFSYFERVMNIFFSVIYGLQYFPERNLIETQMYRSAMGPEMPELWDVVKNCTLIFDNTQPLLELAKPTAHKIVHIGGIAMKPGSEVDNETRTILEGSKDGVILVSFGTFASTEVITGDLLLRFLNAFSAFPRIEFIWKLEVKGNDSAIVSRYENVHAVKFMPQQAILAHPKTLAFVSHMGMNSFIEASTSGVPLIAIPLFADQHYNAAVARERGTAVIVNKLNCTTPNLIRSIRKILDNQRYREAALALKRQLKVYPSDAKKNLLHFVNYLGEFGAVKHFDLAGAELDMMTYYSIDIFVPAALVVLILIYILFKISWVLCRLTFSFVRFSFRFFFVKSKLE